MKQNEVLAMQEKETKNLLTCSFHSSGSESGERDNKHLNYNINKIISDGERP